MKSKKKILSKVKFPATIKEVEITDKCDVINIHLNLKSVWFDLILSGEKKEEYREIKPYFQSFFCKSYLQLANGCKHKNCPNCNWLPKGFKNYKTITFSNGYAKNRRQFVIELLSIRIDFGKLEWGANPNQKYFVLQLGNIISAKC
jgi:hypothetical protein